MKCLLLLVLLLGSSGRRLGRQEEWEQPPEELPGGLLPPHPGPREHPVLHPARHLFPLLEELDTSADRLEVHGSGRLAGAVDNYYYVRGQFNLITRREDGEVVPGAAVQEFVTLAEELGMVDTSITIHRLVEDRHLELYSCQETKKLLKVVMDSHMLAAIAEELSGRASKDMHKDTFADSFKRINAKYNKACL